jgi:hypothetical protein
MYGVPLEKAAVTHSPNGKQRYGYCANHHSGQCKIASIDLAHHGLLLDANDEENIIGSGRFVGT